MYRFLKLFSLLSTIVVTQRPPQPENINLIGTSFLDHDKPINQFWGQTFLRENIPFLDIPNQNIQDVYYYRWSTLQRHLRHTIAGTGYILTEFCQPVGYAQALNTINAAAGHQIDESRWLRSKFYNDDYIQAYTRGPGNSTQYTHWILDAMFRRSQVNGDNKYTTEQLADMVRLWHYWNSVFDENVGLYYFTPNFDAQEYSLPGYVVDPSGGQLQLDGPDTYRPSHNAYMVANARAIAQVAKQSGDSETASNFTQIADRLEQAMSDKLWDPVQEFFVDVIRPNNPNLTKVMGREEVGLYPFRFGVGLEPKYSNASIQKLLDPQGFLTPYGPTTLEVQNEYYFATKPSDYCCYWNGQSWPFSTAHTLKSLAAVIRSGNSSITAEQYVQYLDRYATTQHKDGVPYVAESHHPVLDFWSADSSNHSEHYDHSTNNDDVVTGLLGIIPRSDDILEISPLIPNNRWTNYQSPSPNDTLQVTFARPRNISSVTLALFSDVARGGSVDIPASTEIYGSKGLLTKLSNTSFIPNDRNTFSFEETETEFVSVNMFNKPGVFVGVCELEVWVPNEKTSKYYAVDALLTDAAVMYDDKSTATPRGSVVGKLSNSSVVAFSGYSNSGESTVSVDVKINQVLQGSLELGVTGANYASATMTMTLSAGKNFITLLGGMVDIRYEILEIS
ncbi:hypothetical protein DL98DRAFT_628537 [Cadophora sp. DSE1049]|nr:hypothetical protein DL98DRAFT_628537 [Cadophora sp. DSE1049]